MTEEGSSIKLRFTGGPAFPTQPIPDGAMAGFTGMMLRDWFAGMALTGWLVYTAEPNPPDPVRAAELSYEYADAMLREREK